MDISINVYETLSAFQYNAGEKGECSTKYRFTVNTQKENEGTAWQLSSESEKTAKLGN